MSRTLSEVPAFVVAAIDHASPVTVSMKQVSGKRKSYVFALWKSPSHEDQVGGRYLTDSGKLFAVEFSFGIVVFSREGCVQPSDINKDRGIPTLVIPR